MQSTPQNGHLERTPLLAVRTKQNAAMVLFRDEQKRDCHYTPPTPLKSEASGAMSLTRACRFPPTVAPQFNMLFPCAGQAAHPRLSVHPTTAVSNKDQPAVRKRTTNSQPWPGAPLCYVTMQLNLDVVLLPPFLHTPHHVLHLGKNSCSVWCSVEEAMWRWAQSKRKRSQPLGR